MCGILGILSKDNSHLQRIPSLNNLLKHRGPDDEGFVCINSAEVTAVQFSSEDSTPEIKNIHSSISGCNFKKFDVILAHRRLSIIDLSEKGHCPMTDADGKIWITYNGEIYNYIELREELISCGYKFFTSSDTEVIINSYLNWGTDCVKKFNGMWGFAIYDLRNNSLLMSRDRFGVKPLYYFFENNTFAFSSEMKPMMALLGNKLRVNTKKIPFYILYGNRLNSEETYYENIKSLEASHSLLFSKGKIEKIKYYEIDPIASRNISESKNKTEELVSILKDSIKLRFRSDVPVGTCLSGGFDSSSIVALSKEIDKKNLMTFSAVWKEKECDESRYIDIVNSAYGCLPNKITPKAEEFEDVFKKISYFQEIPTEGPGLIPQWYVMKEAAEKVKVLLDGQGGDEVFGGYFWKANYLRSLISDRKKTKVIKEIGSYVSFLKQNGLHSFTSWILPGAYNKFVRSKSKGRAGILNHDLLKNLSKKDLYLDTHPKKIFGNYLSDLSYHFIRNLTIPSLLHYEDRNSMAFSIESRVPFLDYRVVEFGLNLLPNELVYKNVSRPFYRKALSKYLPKEVTERKDKLGFPTPFLKWSRTILKDFITEKLSNDSSCHVDYINITVLKKNLKRHFEEEIDYSWEIWRLLSFIEFLNLQKRIPC